MVNHIIPNTKQEALIALSKEPLTIVNGATDQYVIHKKDSTIDVMSNKSLFINNIDELNYIEQRDNILHIGATTSLEHIKSNLEVPAILRDAIGVIASTQIRNMATIVGNICNASPAGDTLPVLYVLDAYVVIESLNSKRVVAINEFITGVRQINLNNNELVTEIYFAMPKTTKHLFRKIGTRQADAISKLSIAAMACKEEGKIKDFRVAFGAVYKTVVRSKEVEKLVINHSSICTDLEHKLIKSYNELILPIDDLRSNKEYRRTVSINLLLSFIKEINEL